jgi:trigger factor
MKTSLEKVGNLQRRLKINVPASAVTSAFDQTYKGIQKQANIKGFRQGKAPIATIKSIYGDKVKQDVVQDLIQKHYFKALQEHKLDPISYPEFEFDQVDEGKEFSFSANFDVKPEVALKKVEGLEVEKEIFEVPEAKIEEVLTNIRISRAEQVPVLEDRPAKNGDIAVVDFEGFVEGKPLENGAGTDHHLELGANQFIEGFEPGVVGMKVGDKKTLNLKFPSPYHAAELEGKSVDFNVTLKTLKKKELPEINDEFVAKMMGQAVGNEKHTLESLKKTIRDDLEQSEKKRIETDFRNRMLRKLVQANPVDVPPSLLAEQKQTLISDMQKRMKEQGISDAEFDAYIKKWDKDFETSASEMIQSGFIIDTLAKEKNLSWTEEDLEKKFEEYAKQTGIEIARIKEFYSKPDQMSRVTYSITEEKVLEFLLKSTKIKEVPAKDISDRN